MSTDHKPHHTKFLKFLARKTVKLWSQKQYSMCNLDDEKVHSLHCTNFKILKISKSFKSEDSYNKVQMVVLGLF